MGFASHRYFVCRRGRRWQRGEVPAQTDEITPLDLALHAAAYSPSLDLFLVAGDGQGANPYLASTPGAGGAWTQRGAAVAFNAVLNGLLWTGAAFVACGIRPASACFLRSADGVAFTDQSNSGQGIECKALAYNAAGNVLVGAGGPWNAFGCSATFKSIDGGLSWGANRSDLTGQGARWLYAICWTGTNFIAAGEPAADGHTNITYSPNGTQGNWTRVQPPNNLGATCYSLGFGNGKAVGACSGNQFLVSSDNGLTWAIVAGPAGAGQFNAVLYTGRQWLVTTAAGELYAGRDISDLALLRTWGGALNAIAYNAAIGRAILAGAPTGAGARAVRLAGLA